MLRILLSEKLNEQTNVQHQLLEKQIILLIKNIYITGDYARLLNFFYTFFGGLELLVDNMLNPHFLPDYQQRRKISLLGDDLHALNVPVQPFAKGANLPQVNNHLQALGAMYVMEGSSLGGQHIAKMINAKIRLPNAMSFFNGYQHKTQFMWQTFQKAMDVMATDQNEDAVVVNAANDTFSSFSNWITRQ